LCIRLFSASSYAVRRNPQRTAVSRHPRRPCYRARVAVHLPHNRCAQREARNLRLTVRPRLVRLSVMHQHILPLEAFQALNNPVRRQHVDAQVILNRERARALPALLRHVSHNRQPYLAAQPFQRLLHLKAASAVLFLIPRKGNQHVIIQFAPIISVTTAAFVRQLSSVPISNSPLVLAEAPPEHAVDVR
jgi:hypothetical protein